MFAGVPPRASKLEKLALKLSRHRPPTPGPWIKADVTKIGYEISFTRHFYQPQMVADVVTGKIDVRPPAVCPPSPLTLAD